MAYKVKTDIISKDGGKCRKICLANDNVSKGDLIVSIGNAFMRIEDTNSPEFTGLIAKAEEDSDSARTNPILVTLYDDTMRVTLSIDDGAGNVTEGEVQGEELEKIVGDVIADIFDDKYVQYRFMNGLVVLQSGYVLKGQCATYRGATPEKQQTKEVEYVFDGWSPDVSTPLTTDTDFTAEYLEIPRLYEVKILGVTGVQEGHAFDRPTDHFSSITINYPEIQSPIASYSGSLYGYNWDEGYYYINLPYGTKGIWNTATHEYVFTNSAGDETIAIITPALKEDTAVMFYEMYDRPTPIDISFETTPMEYFMSFNARTVHAQKGPCDSGLHIPSYTEFSTLLNNLIQGGMTIETISEKLNFFTDSYGEGYESYISYMGLNAHEEFIKRYWTADCESNAELGFDDPVGVTIKIDNSTGFEKKLDSSCCGYHIKAFYDISVDPTTREGWTKTYESGTIQIWHSAYEHLLSIYAGNVWTTILDSDLFADYGHWSRYVFEWGNCELYRKDLGDNIRNKTATKVDASDNGPTNLYSGDSSHYYITEDGTESGHGSWDSSHNTRLWGMGGYIQAEIEAHEVKRYPGGSYSGSYS